jgi:DNA-binding transcriptional ArsR family regulator
VTEVDVYRALADPTRRAILDELSEHRDLTLAGICAALGHRHGLTLTRQAVSQHLGLLESAGLVTVRRAGRTKLHRIDTTPLHTIVARWLHPATADVSP